MKQSLYCMLRTASSMGKGIWRLTLGVIACIILAKAAPPSHERVKRVIGGFEIQEGAWPWLVALKGKIPSRTFFGIPLEYRTFYCGGSIVNSRWILTAAHCFKENNLGSRALEPDYWHVKLGDIDRTSSFFQRVKGFFGNLFNVDDLRDWYLHAETIVIHPQYDRAENWANDIALVKLEESVPTGSDDVPEIQSVPLASTSSFPAAGSRCVMKGWGCQQGGGSVTDIARQVTLPILTNSRCSSYWGIPAVKRLCAGHNFQDMGICSGDSGGPLVCRNGSRWVQTGIASFTSGSTPEDHPGVFTRVSYYKSWIDSVVSQN